MMRKSIFSWIVQTANNNKELDVIMNRYNTFYKYDCCFYIPYITAIRNNFPFNELMTQQLSTCVKLLLCLN